MLLDFAPFDDVWSHVAKRAGRSTAAFVHFLERRLSAKIGYDASIVPHGDYALLELAALAEKMRSRGIITGWGSVASFPDEPPLFQWSAEYATSHSRGERTYGGGASAESDRDALIAALAESAERYVWGNKSDYFERQILATVSGMRGKRIIAPESFAGFSDQQRAMGEELTLRKDAKYLWIRAYSWITKWPTWVPAQVISGSQEMSAERRARGEPLIALPITHGLATRERREAAVLHGALELIERDAFMITWLNQLSAPRFDLDELALRSRPLAKILRDCERYRLRPSAVRMPTDAPAYAALGIVEDETGSSPSFTIGLKAYRDPAAAAAGALLEALRSRQRIRLMRLAPKLDWDPERKPQDIGHHDRLLYWAEGDRSNRLHFLRSGAEREVREPWEGDSEAEHFARVIAWAKERGYELASVAMTKSAGNVTPWHIEMVTIPQLQPLHLSEKYQYLGGARLAEVPKRFGYRARATPFADEPHPFS